MKTTSGSRRCSRYHRASTSILGCAFLCAIETSPAATSRRSSGVNSDHGVNRAESVAPEQGREPRVDRSYQAGTFVDQAGVEFNEVRPRAQMAVSVGGVSDSTDADDRKRGADAAADRPDG